MRTPVFVLIAVVVGYFAYNLWFAPEEAEEEPVRIGAQEPEHAEAASPEAAAGDTPDAAGASSAGAEKPRGLVIQPDLDLEGGSAVEPAETAPAAESAADKREKAAWSFYSDLKDARNAGDAKKAKQIETVLLGGYAETDAGRMLSFEKGRQELRRWEQMGRSGEGLKAAHEARRLMTPALFLRERPDPRQHAALRDCLAKLADAVLFGPGAVDGVVYTYKTKSGDALSVLCNRVFPKKYGVHVEPGLVMRMNGLARPQDLKAGVYIRVPAGKPTIVVVKREFRLYYLLDGAYVRDWPVGLGAGGSTPVGTFTIESKIQNPDWFPKQGVKIKYGDPQNILGTRWMGFANAPGLTGFGIHGTTLPDSIGREESSGCVRMHRQDVEELFGWTPRKTPVIIRP